MLREDFGTTADGRPVERLVIGAGRLRAAVLTLGAILQDVRLDGHGPSLTLGSDRLADYEGALRYHGGIIGPVAGRIAGAEADIAGRRCRFDANLGPDTLHGGATGTQGLLWQVVEHAPDRLVLGLTLADGLGGFPGNRRITATFLAEAPARLSLSIEAVTDAPTLANLTNHSYWRLGGPETRSQVLRCAAERHVELNPAKLATGRTPPVAGTRYDFRAGAEVGAGDLDICFCLADARREMTPAATLEAGGITLTVDTTEAGLQVYDGADPGALAIEAQNWPGAAVQPGFPSDLLLPGEVRRQVTRWSFEG